MKSRKTKFYVDAITKQKPIPSIRKYHFGAAGVILGMAVALIGGTEQISAEETVATEVVSSTVKDESSTQVEATISAETTTAAQRQAKIAYRVIYKDVATGDVFKPEQVQYAVFNTTDKVASTTVTVKADKVRTGYELVDASKATVTQVISEDKKNEIVFEIKKSEVATEEKAVEGTTGFRALTNPDATGHKLGEQSGILADNVGTASPTFTEANNAQIASRTQGAMVATSEAGYYTFSYAPLST